VRCAQSSSRPTLCWWRPRPRAALTLGRNGPASVRAVASASGEHPCDPGRGGCPRRFYLLHHGRRFDRRGGLAVLLADTFGSLAPVTHTNTLRRETARPFGYAPRAAQRHPNIRRQLRPRSNPHRVHALTTTITAPVTASPCRENSCSHARNRSASAKKSGPSTRATRTPGVGSSPACRDASWYVPDVGS
jgi:hypothetical protein